MTGRLDSTEVLDIAVRLFVAWQIVWGMVTFAAMWRDKRLATRSRQRTPEKDLHRLEAWGGWAGSLAAQLLFRHKTRKASYQRTFRAIAFGWVTAWVLTGALHVLRRFYI